jgi:hypothetical protein
MAKILKTATALTALINAELSKHLVCESTGVGGISPVVDDRVDQNWTCKFLRKSGSLPPRLNVDNCLLLSCVSFSKNTTSHPRHRPQKVVPARSSGTPWIRGQTDRGSTE